MSENDHTASILGFIVALAGGVATILLMAYASSGKALSMGSIVFYAWVASPFIILSWLNLHCLRTPAPHALRLAASITSCALLLSVVLYADTVFSPGGSTASLVLFVLPAWSLAASGATLLVSFLVVLWRSGH